MRFTAPKASLGQLVGLCAIQRLGVGVDRDAGPQRKGDSVTGSAVDRNLFAIGLEVDGGIIGIFLKVADNDSPQVRMKGCEEGKGQVVGQGARGFDPLQRNGDALGLKRSDEEREFTLLPFAAKEYGRLIASLSGGYAQHLHFV